MEKNKKLIVGWPLGKRIKNKIKGINEKVERGETCFVRWRKEWISKVGGGRAGDASNAQYIPLYIYFIMFQEYQFPPLPNLKKIDLAQTGKFYDVMKDFLDIQYQLEIMFVSTSVITVINLHLVL